MYTCTQIKDTHKNVEALQAPTCTQIHALIMCILMFSCLIHTLCILHMQAPTLISYTLWHVCTNPNVCTNFLPVAALTTANGEKISKKQHSHCLPPLTPSRWDAGHTCGERENNVLYQCSFSLIAAVSSRTLSVLLARHIGECISSLALRWKYRV